MQMSLRVRIAGITVMVAYLVAALFFVLVYLFAEPETGSAPFEDAVKHPPVIENPDTTPVPNANNPPDTARKSAWQFMRTRDPRISVLRRFAKAMGIKITTLLREADEKAAKQTR